MFFWVYVYIYCCISLLTFTCTRVLFATMWKCYIFDLIGHIWPPKIMIISIYLSLTLFQHVINHCYGKASTYFDMEEPHYHLCEKRRKTRKWRSHCQEYEILISWVTRQLVVTCDHKGKLCNISSLTTSIHNCMFGYGDDAKMLQ